MIKLENSAFAEMGSGAAQISTIIEIYEDKFLISYGFRSVNR
jgi:hypothetical protein